MATASTVTTGGLTWAAPSRPEPIPTSGLFEASVLADDTLVLTPCTELAKSLLAAWASQEMRFVMQYRAAGPEMPLMKRGAGMEEARLVFSSRPMLVMGDDPWYTGMILSPEDVKVARNAVERARERRRTEASEALKKIVKPSAKLDELQAAGVKIELTPKKRRRAKR